MAEIKGMLKSKTKLFYVNIFFLFIPNLVTV